MSKIFISWGNDDADIVTYIKGRFRKLGLDFFEYSDAMLAGQEILTRIKEEIDSSKIAVICLSDSSCSRPWVISEVTLLYEAKENGKLKEIIPIQVGPLDLDNLPPAMEGKYKYIPNVSQPYKFENESDRLITQIYRILYGQEPVTLPTVLLAMNTKEFSEIIPDLEEDLSVVNTCGYLGMGDPMQVLKSLELRYGQQEADFAPFCGDQPLIKIIQNVTDRLNKKRMQEKKKPVFISWLNDEVFSKDPAARGRARDLLRGRSSLIILDSLSTFHSRIKDQYTALLFSNSAILWVPPFSQWTGALVAKTSDLIQGSEMLHDFFRDWRGESEDYSKSLNVNYEFGLFTQPSLNHWLYRVIEESTTPTADQSYINKMNNEYGKTPISPHHFK